MVVAPVTANVEPADKNSVPLPKLLLDEIETLLLELTIVLPE